MKEDSIYKDPIFVNTLIAIILMFIVVRPIVIPTDSMENTINEPSLVMGYNIHFTSVKRGDIIGFNYNDEGKKKLYIKRVIGMPGDSVTIKGDTITVNGEILQEDYLYEPMLPYEHEVDDYIEFEYEPSKNGLHFYDFDGKEIVWKYSSADDDSDKLYYFEEDELYDRTFVVPSNQYFCMGDNRNNSYDSRMWENPFVKEEDIRYQIIMQMFPMKVYDERSDSK